MFKFLRRIFGFRWTFDAYRKSRFRRRQRNYDYFAFLFHYELHSRRFLEWYQEFGVWLDRWCFAGLFHCDKYLQNYYPTLHYVIYQICASPLIALALISSSYGYLYYILSLFPSMYHPSIIIDMHREPLDELFIYGVVPFLWYIIYLLSVLFLLDRLFIFRNVYVYYLAAFPILLGGWVTIIHFQYYLNFWLDDVVVDKILGAQARWRAFKRFIKMVYVRFYAAENVIRPIMKRAYDDRIRRRKLVAAVFEKEEGRPLRWGYDDGDLIIISDTFPYRHLPRRFEYSYYQNVIDDDSDNTVDGLNHRLNY